MDNPDTQPTVDTRHRTKTNKTQDTEQRQIKQKTQRRKQTRWATQAPP
jgi:hypothetical protein